MRYSYAGSYIDIFVYCSLCNLTMKALCLPECFNLFSTNAIHQLLVLQQ